ncbi:Mitogen-activated protein kinase kinase kinase 1 [Giardia lamblia P15]|uniref:Mitogen-activated protein kinase kinase kinase 1 n=1 Tax=Giardia intestinalis (strain P15) TaxID=658858 RepID=E1F4L7_GIAIA|nr:Mitogen-activated protein kinase kinase kinase 1 [Giardia lamblia P15]
MKVKTPAWVASAIEAAQTAHFYIIAQPGPLVFILRERDDDSTVKVSLGSPHACSCESGSHANYCIHISFLLQRKYQLPPDHPWTAQTSLTNADIESLLQLRHLATKKVHRSTQPIVATPEDHQVRQPTTVPQLTRPRNPITELDSCPICLDGFMESDEEEINYAVLPFCSNCGNSLHSRCIQLFHQHARQTKAKEVCPYCRSPYEDGRKYYPSAGSGTEKTVKTKKSLKVCSRCEIRLESVGIKRVFGPEQYCSTCFITLTSGMYTKKSRRVLIRAKHEDPDAARERVLALYRRFASIQYREITSEDYHLLLELENPYTMDISKKPQRFPSYLIWDCFKQKVCKDAPREAEGCACFLCEHYHPTLSNLLVKRGCCPPSATIESKVITDDKPVMCLNFDSVATILLEQGEQSVSSASLQELQEKNTYLDLPCMHTVHKLCAILGSLLCKPEAVFTISDEQESCELSDYRLKMFPDYCIACKTPYLSEWVRGSKLAPKQPQAVPPLRDPSEKQAIRKLHFEDQLPRIIADKDTLSVTGLPLSGRPSTETSRTKSQHKLPELARSKSLAVKPLKKSSRNSLSTNMLNEQSSSSICKSSFCDPLTIGMVIKPFT